LPISKCREAKASQLKESFIASKRTKKIRYIASLHAFHSIAIPWTTIYMGVMMIRLAWRMLSMPETVGEVLSPNITDPRTKERRERERRDNSNAFEKVSARQRAT